MDGRKACEEGDHRAGQDGQYRYLEKPQITIPLHRDPTDLTNFRKLPLARDVFDTSTYAHCTASITTGNSSQR